MKFFRSENSKKTRSISASFLVIAVGLVLATSVTVGFWQIWQNEKSNIKYEDERLTFAVQRVVKDLRAVVEDASRNVAMLGGTPPIQGILSSRKSGAIPEIAMVQETIWKDRLAQIFLSLAESDQNLMQVRLIGNDGKEMIRVNSSAGRATRVKQKDLQDKSDRPYVLETLSSNRDKINYFGIDYNRERGVIEEPRILVMRVATRVWGKDDEPLGMIIVNINMSKVIANLAFVIREPQQFILFNEQGSYLSKPPQIEAASVRARSGQTRLVDKPRSLQTDFPRLAGNMVADWVGGPSQTLGLVTEDYVARVSRIRFDWSDSEHYLLAAVMTPMAQLLAQNREMKQQIILFTALLALIGALIAFVLTHQFVKPIRQLSNAARQLSLGAPVDSLKLDGEHRNDEIGVLLRSVHHMASNLEEKQKRIGAILATAKNPILMINRRGIIREVNEATIDLFGFSRHELIGKNVSMLMNEHDKVHHDSYLRHHGTGTPSKIFEGGREVSAIRKDGSPVQVHLAVSRLLIKGEVFFTGIMTDLTELKKVDKLKSEFVSTVSHELRTPLTSIKGALGLLRSTSTDALPEHAGKMLDIAYSNCDRLSLLINDILDMEKIEAGKLSYEFQSFDTVTFLEDVVETNRAYGKQHGVSFELDCPDEPILIFADHCRLEQVITNLLSNAAKYASEGEKVIVSAEPDRESGRLRIAVTDFGSGIPEDFRDKVFDKFAQADASDTRAKGGTGLGLAISREIIMAHSGVLDFETEAGVGTTFYIILDILPEEKASTEPEAA
ncbi:PAS domain S-box-containing protein [Cohaesibacter marisflavi]|uniref:histidine kinase n=1 Tax=Cohaesibacter marisflavi TaxID=655353 RepID=A0A1I5CLQ6_9HYPH|nr:ATP-binding protein [Cohaesibacter marisflavi]SFN87843.1 PAS domain S-box-containing protein [Cohaesibacter marisflavi]